MRRFADYLENVKRLKDLYSQAEDRREEAEGHCSDLGYRIHASIKDLGKEEALSRFLDNPGEPSFDFDNESLLDILVAEVDDLKKLTSSFANWYHRYIEYYGKALDAEDEYYTAKKKMDQAKQEHEEYLSERVV